ncbi:MAG: GNAT family N-acetyltransferase [Pseudomonas sp.]
MSGAGEPAAAGVEVLHRGFALRPLRPDADAALLHDWVVRDYARFWGMQQATRAQVAAFYRRLQDSGTASAWLGFSAAGPAFLVECYDPAHDEIGQHYPVQPGDRGMHLLLAPCERRIAGFSLEAMRAVLDFIFADPAAQRVVVEPDLRNAAIQNLNQRAGFRHARVVQLREKQALLSFCTRDAHRAAADHQPPGDAMSLLTDVPTLPELHAAHLDPEHWAAANRHLLCKAIAEFAHELLLEPEQTGRDGDWRHYRLRTDAATQYTFRARRLRLDHWHLDEASLARERDGVPAELDAAAFIAECATPLGISAETLPVYLEEIASTLYGACYKRGRGVPGAAALAQAPFQRIESAMSEGHPVFVANNGRIGFGADDYLAHAPETGAPVRLVWLAVHCDCARFSAIDGLEHRTLLEQELGAQLDGFERRLRGQGLDPRDYLLMPAHPWQWSNKLCHVFASELAARRIVCLGYGEDRYQAQQSIRTFFNLDHPRRHYVKTALSVLNMGFMRGLSPYYMEHTPAINQWLKGLVEADPFLRACGFDILREVAAVGYRHPLFEWALPPASAYRKMLAALWRESATARLRPGRRAMTMAALLHRDDHGAALLPALIEASGIGCERWVRAYLRAYLAPLLHCFYAYELVFMPHGENLILVLEDHVPVHVLMKDIAEEIAVMDPQAALPEQVRRIAVSVPEDMKVLSLFTDVFDCFFRFVSAILAEHGDCDEARFWGWVAECIHDYQDAHPQYAARFARHDLFAPRFRRSCLNRLQLRNNRQMVDLADPAGSLCFAGELDNPIAEFARR